MYERGGDFGLPLPSEHKSCKRMNKMIKTVICGTAMAVAGTSVAQAKQAFAEVDFALSLNTC